jgi:60 kDa SS-A/Ro ribonucleoprotein
MVHPTPSTASRRALFGYLIGKSHDASVLPALVQRYEDFKNGTTQEVANVPFQMLTQLELSTRQWSQVARNAKWQMTRMNLNTFSRHGVFHDPAMVELVAKRLAKPDNVRRARAFPYQLMVAYAAANVEIPQEIRDALQDAMEVAVANVPRVRGPVYVLPDVSGSMQSPVTGYRKGATSVVRCIDVAALVAAAFLRTNGKTEVVPFHDKVQPCRLNPRDSVMTNATKLAKLPSGGTDCAAPLRWLNERNARGNLVVFVSDNQSWIDKDRGWNPGTAVMKQWEQYKRRNRKAKLVCIDVQPYASSQAPDRADILNVGGFSDSVFEVIAAFFEDALTPGHWTGEIERIEI